MLSVSACTEYINIKPSNFQFNIGNLFLVSSYHGSFRLANRFHNNVYIIIRNVTELNSCRMISGKLVLLMSILMDLVVDVITKR